MEQGQLHRPDSDKQQQQEQVEEAINYGDVFEVKGDLANQKVAPRDAAVMQSAENKAFGYIQKGGPASAMQSAANKNEKAGFVGHNDVSDAAAAKGVAISETNLPGKRMISELIGGQVTLNFLLLFIICFINIYIYIWIYID